MYSGGGLLRECAGPKGTDWGRTEMGDFGRDGKDKCAPSDLRRKEMGPIRDIPEDIGNRQGM